MKPLHYLYRRSIFSDVMASCGAGGSCYVKNDKAGEPFDGTVHVSALEFSTGKMTTLHDYAASLPVGAGVSERFTVDVSSISASTHLLIAECVDGQSKQTLSTNEILLGPPKDLKLPAASISIEVAKTANADGSASITLTSSHTALYVVLTTLAHGRFSDNAFAMGPGKKSVTFLPVGPLDLPTLTKSVRVEHMQQMQ